MVEDGKIVTLFDTDETVGDQMLLEVLDEGSDTKMKSIVTTIQKNKIRSSAILTQNCYLFKGQLVQVRPQLFYNEWRIYCIAIGATSILVK